MSATVQELRAENEREDDPLAGLAKGVFLANDAINCLKKIPTDDPLRARGYEIVQSFIEHNK